ncbi:MAG: pitrilysin family protein, partial [Thermoanaerobaculia bacterium]|nr:pitrilysin family protein [Thermoanaerobaculia bacterium]
MTPAELDAIRLERLGNGLTVAIVPSDQAPIVTTVVWYRVGCRHEAEAEAGIAHFLEHMMFKGSAAYGPGEIDRLTQALGGSNNAFTSHDATAYYFELAADCWTTALDVERDRMVSLELDADEVASERQVILEEIAMYESDPWDALERRVQAELFGAHPYGRPVLGTPESLASIGAEELRDFHHRSYRPDRTVIVVAGAVGPEACDEVERRFGDLPLPPTAPELAAVPAPPGSPGRRLSRRQG